MKTLFITPYLSIDKFPEFCVNKTGFGYMVSDIADSLGKNIELDVYATDSRSKRRKHGSFNIIERNIFNIIVNIYHCVSIIPTIKLICKYHPDFGTGLRLLYYWASSGYIRKTICDNNYDIIHIHDLSMSTPLWLQIAKSCDKPYLITLHALKSFSDTIKISEYGKRFERDFFKTAVANGCPMSVLSTGMKQLIKKSTGCEKMDNVFIVPNARFLIDVNKENSFNIKELHRIPYDAKIVLCVGNISRRKNQHQLIRAFELLPDNVAENTYMLFLGGSHEDDYSETFLTKGCKRKDKYIFCGAVEKSKVSNYYIQADAVALVSKSEAFGLSLIEGMYYGLPCLMHNDMEAYNEIYKDGCAVAILEYSDECVALGLQQLITRDWDSELIKNHSRLFSPEIMSERYMDLYANLINK